MAVFLALLLTGCGVNTATESAQPEETTADIATGSTQPETTARIATVPEEKSAITAETAPPPERMTPATVAPVGRVTAIGDRVMKGAVRALQREEIPDFGVVDVQGSLQTPAAIDILRQRRRPAWRRCGSPHR